MLELKVIIEDSFDEERNEFLSKTFDLRLEHSLLSLSKWEAEYEKPFLSKDEKTPEEILAYVRAMTLTENVPDDVYDSLSIENQDAINAYISAKRTATWFSDNSKEPARSSEIVTSELIYYWMLSYNIPLECETWHLNRLFTLIRVFSVKNSKPKKLSHREIAARNRELNASRRAKLKSKG